MVLSKAFQLLTQHIITIKIVCIIIKYLSIIYGIPILFCEMNNDNDGSNIYFETMEPPSSIYYQVY